MKSASELVKVGAVAVLYDGSIVEVLEAGEGEDAGSWLCEFEGEHYEYVPVEDFTWVADEDRVLHAVDKVFNPSFADKRIDALEQLCDAELRERPYTVALADCDNQYLGLKLQSWHSSGGDPIYALGSTLYSRAVELADSAASAAVVLGAATNLSRSCYEEFNAGRTAEAAEAGALANEVLRRFGWLLEKYPAGE